MWRAALLVLYVAVGLIAQPGVEPVRDEPALLAAAERLVEHGQLAGTGSDPDQRAFLWHGPGLVVLVAPFVALDVPLQVIRLTSPLLLLAAVALLHGGLRRHVPPRVAVGATVAFALYLPFVIVLGTVQKEPLAILLIVVAIRLVADGGPARLAGAGLALGGLAMVRPEYGWVVLALLAAALVAWTVMRTPAARWRVLVPAVAVLACAPWLAYTERLTGQPLYWSSSGGLSLFWMSPTLPGETGQWHSPVRVHRDRALAPYRPLFRRLDQVHPLESDLELRERAIHNIRRDPALYLRNLAANAARLVVFAPTRPAQPPSMLVVYALGNGALLLALAWASARLWRRRRALPPEVPALALFAVLGVGVHLPPSASPRMLLPLVPVLVWLVARAAALPEPRRSVEHGIAVREPRFSRMGRPDAELRRARGARRPAAGTAGRPTR